jgi:hypothetical protein
MQNKCKKAPSDISYTDNKRNIDRKKIRYVVPPIIPSITLVGDNQGNPCRDRACSVRRAATRRAAEAALSDSRIGRARLPLECEESFHVLRDRIPEPFLSARTDSFPPGILVARNEIRFYL